MEITQMRVNNVDCPLGFNIEQLSFSWKVSEVVDEQKTKCVRVRIFQENTVVFDSGNDYEANSADYLVRICLQPRTKYVWSVEVEADNGTTAEGESYFETGKMYENWSGKWISPEQEDRNLHPVMRRRFNLTKEDAEKNSRMYICGLGVYEAYINEKKIGNEYLAPGYHSYDFHLQTQTYDITGYLKEGENEIKVILGDGWFKGRLGFDGGFTNVYGDCCQLIAELYIGNIKEPIVFTDENWEYSKSQIVESNIYDGEIYDARIEDELLKNSSWKRVVIIASTYCGKLCDRYSLPIVKQEEFEPEIIKTPKGETVLDFTQNLTGWVEFDAKLSKGVIVTLTASEILQDGSFYRDNLRTAKAEFIYISNGNTAHVRPHFTFYGFRYMKVEIKKEDNVQDITDKYISDICFKAYHLRSDFGQIGEIKTGDEKVNRLFLNALWGQKDNFLDVPTDCPQRDERLGWTGDAQLFSETACYNMYMPAFYRKYLWDMRAEQSILEGSVPNVVPRLKRGMVAEHGSSPWADAGVIIPWNVYMHYGNRTLLNECYEGMKAWVDYERKKEEELGGPHLIKYGFHFADWLALDNDASGPFGATNPLFVASAYYYKNASILSESARVLGNLEDEKIYGDLAKEILSAIKITYYNEEGLCICNTQTGSAISIMFRLNPSEEARIREGAALVAKINANNEYLNTGFVGTTMLCPALTETGHSDKAMNLLLNEEYPGWLYSVKMGATTIWERWNSVMPDGHINEDGMNSLNHYAYGSIEAWMYGYVCGIKPKEPGFKKAIIEPHPDKRLGHASCNLDTAFGRYYVSWRYEGDMVIYELDIPFDTIAEFRCEGIDSKILKAGKYTFRTK